MTFPVRQAFLRLTWLGATSVWVLMVACHSGEVGGTTVGPSASASTVSAGGMGASGGEGGAGGMAGAGGVNANGGAASVTGSSSTAMACMDVGPGESNETATSATQLASLNDCDEEVKTVTATINGPDDVDWYFFKQTEDTTFCQVGPARKFSQSAGGALRVCKYVDCQTGEPPSISCPSGTTKDVGPGGVPGCCGTKSFDVDLGFWGCEGSSDILNIYLRVDDLGTDPGLCNQYNINYNL